MQRVAVAAAVALLAGSACTESCSKRANAPTCDQVNWSETVYASAVIGLIVVTLAFAVWLRRRRR
jgi:hypothetical protein